MDSKGICLPKIYFLFLIFQVYTFVLMGKLSKNNNKVTLILLYVLISRSCHAKQKKLLVPEDRYLSYQSSIQGYTL